jgi:hypothetical protein
MATLPKHNEMASTIETRTVLDVDAFSQFAHSLERPARRIPAIQAALRSAGYASTD